MSKANYARYDTFRPGMVSMSTQTLKKGPGAPGRRIFPPLPKIVVGTSGAQGGSRTQTSTINANKKSREYKKIPKKSVQVDTVSELVKAGINTISKVCQKIAEGDSQTGANFLRNIAGTTSERPCHVYAINTTDRDAGSGALGDAYTQFILTQTGDFLHPVQPTGTSDPSPVIVYGNHPHHTALNSYKVLFADFKCKIQLYGRQNRATKYQIQVIRLRKPFPHLCPYLGSEEALDASVRLTASQLQERRAMWIDNILRPHTVNPSVLTGYALTRVKKMYEVVYNRTVEIEETLADEEQANRTDITISLPVNKMVNYNWEADSRYANQTLADRVDAPLNTDVTDISDLLHGHKLAPHAGLFLVITANNTTTTSEDSTQGTGATYVAEKLPSYDISWMCRYKALSLT